MGKRRDGRECAVQFLYYNDLNPENDRSIHDNAFWNLVGSECPNPSQGVRDFAASLVAGVGAHREELDQRIDEYSANYRIQRIAAVDRNILRLALYEMFHREDVPPVVVISEAIEIAKRFGGAESGKFVNGILDRAKNDVDRPLRGGGTIPPSARSSSQ